MSTITSTVSGFHKDLLVVDHAKLDGMSQGDLVELAKVCNGKAIKAAKQTLLHVGQTGFVLLALKAKTPHGQFLKYVQTLTEIPARTAQSYMQIASEYATVAHLRGVRDAIAYIREAGAESKRLSPLSSSIPLASTPKTPLPLGAVRIDAEIVEPEIDEIDEPETLVVDEAKPAPAIADKATGLIVWGWARQHLHTIKQDDGQLDQALNECIAYCHSRLDGKRDALAAIVATVPRLTEAEIVSLIETLKARLP